MAASLTGIDDKIFYVSIYLFLILFKVLSVKDEATCTEKNTKQKKYQFVDELVDDALP